MEQKINWMAQYIDKEKLKRKKCNKCSKRSIYILIYCDPMICLCKDHAPKLSNGEPAYNKLTIKDKAPEGFAVDYISIEPKETPPWSCYYCHKKVTNKRKFTQMGKDSYFWECKDGYGCAIEQD